MPAQSQAPNQWGTSPAQQAQALLNQQRRNQSAGISSMGFTGNRTQEAPSRTSLADLYRLGGSAGVSAGGIASAGTQAAAPFTGFMQNQTAGGLPQAGQAAGAQQALALPQNQGTASSAQQATSVLAPATASTVAAIPTQPAYGPGAGYMSSADAPNLPGSVSANLAAGLPAYSGTMVRTIGPSQGAPGSGAGGALGASAAYANSIAPQQPANLPAGANWYGGHLSFPTAQAYGAYLGSNPGNAYEVPTGLGGTGPATPGGQVPGASRISMPDQSMFSGSMYRTLDGQYSLLQSDVYKQSPTQGYGIPWHYEYTGGAGGHA